MIVEIVREKEKLGELGFLLIDSHRVKKMKKHSLAIWFSAKSKPIQFGAYMLPTKLLFFFGLSLDEGIGRLVFSYLLVIYY